MLRHWIKTWLIGVAIATLLGCSTDKDELMPHGSQTMLDLWNGSSGSSVSGPNNRQLMDARQQLRRPLTEHDDHEAYTRTAQNEIYSQFHRLPNPDLVMFVFPHLTGTDPAPIPGYSTVFPLYQRVQYAMPGERIEDY